MKARPCESGKGWWHWFRFKAVFLKTEVQELWFYIRNRGISESFCLLTQLCFCVDKMAWDLPCDGAMSDTVCWELTIAAWKLWGGAAGSLPSWLSQIRAFLVLGDHHIPSPVTGKEAAPLSASPTRKLFIHIKWWGGWISHTSLVSLVNTRLWQLYLWLFPHHSYLLKIFFFNCCFVGCVILYWDPKVHFK